MVTDEPAVIAEDPAPPATPEAPVAPTEPEQGHEGHEQAAVESTPRDSLNEARR